MSLKTSSIRFRPNMYKVFRNIPNTAWNALCEFIDNSIQASINVGRICKISIEITSDYITIRDNGPGFSEKDLETGLEPSRIPEDKSQLNEFGMGMKLAALFFGDRYEIKTSEGRGALSELVFDLDEVVENHLEEIPIKLSPYDGESFTSITIDKLSDATKIDVDLELDIIRDYLSQIYAYFLDNGSVMITINELNLVTSPIEVLSASWYDDDDDDDERQWFREFKVRNGEFSISGFVALRDPMSNTNKGFQLIRRGRVVAGIKENVKPHVLFGQPSSHLSKRLFGRIHVEGFGISFNKSDLLNTSELDELWRLLKNELDNDEYSILKMGRLYRVSKKREKVSSKPKTKTATVEYISPIKIVETTEVQQSYSFKINEQVLNINCGKKTGHFVQSNNPITLRSDFFDDIRTRETAINIIKDFGDTYNIEIVEDKIANLIEKVWQHLK